MTPGSIEPQYPLNIDGIGLEIQPHFDLLPNSPLYHASLESATFSALLALNNSRPPEPLSITDWFISDPDVGDSKSREEAHETNLENPQAQLCQTVRTAMGPKPHAIPALSHAEPHRMTPKFPQYNRAPSRVEGVRLSKQHPYSREMVKIKTEEPDVPYLDLGISLGSNRHQNDTKHESTNTLFTQLSDPVSSASLPYTFKNWSSFSTNAMEQSTIPLWPGTPLLFTSQLSSPLDSSSEPLATNPTTTAGSTPSALYPIKPKDSPPPKTSTSNFVIGSSNPPIGSKPPYLPHIVIPVLPTTDKSTNHAPNTPSSVKKSRKTIVRAGDSRVRQSARLCCSKGYTGPNGDWGQHKASTRVKLLECNLNGALDDPAMFEKIINAHMGCNLSAITRATSYYGMDLALWNYLVERASDPNNHRVTKIGIQSEAKRLWDDYLNKYPMFKDGKKTSHFSSTWIKNFLPRHGIDVCHQKIRISRISASSPLPEKLNPAWYNYLAKNHPKLLDQ